MGIKQRIMEYFLNKSGSYRFYKSQYEKLSKNNYPVKTNKNQKIIVDNYDYEDIAMLKANFNQYKEITDDYIESYNHLFNTLFLDYKLEPRPLLGGLQGICVELLQFCDNVCKKYDLQWWVDFGNLIGAARHEGFVPWDDDTDIGMMRSDYLKFNEVIGKEIEKHNLDDIITVSHRKRPVNCDISGSPNIKTFLQLFVVDRDEKGKRALLAGVDVFPYDYLKDFDPETFDSLYYESKLKYYEDLHSDIGIEKSVDNLYENLNMSYEESKYVVHGVEGACGPRNLYKMLIVDKNTLFPLKRMKYMDKMFPCPNDHETYLRTVYGDYMKIPKSIRTHSRVSKFRYVEDAQEKFQNYIDLLKDVNENFEF
ncbi:MAG: LicD family protein [Methanobrevibacter sp.]|nr:LicD family protein [Methanobrevibacter sp.]